MKHSVFIATLLLFFACQSNKNKLIVTFENANGIENGTSVVLNEFQIGEVTNISLDSEYKIAVEIKFNKDIQLPKDSKFTVESQDFFTKRIVVNPGVSTSYLSKSDKIKGDIAEGIKIDTLFTIISDQLNNSKPVQNQDSILVQLQEINQEMKGINKKIGH